MIFSFLTFPSRSCCAQHRSGAIDHSHPRSHSHSRSPSNKNNNNNSTNNSSSSSSSKKEELHALRRTAMSASLLFDTSNAARFAFKRSSDDIAKLGMV